MKKTCSWCKKEFDYKVEYGSDQCLFCCRDQEHIIFYSDAKRLYKLNDEQLFNNGLQMVKFKMRGSSQMCRKFIRNEVHLLADKLSKDLELGHRLRRAYEKADYMYKEERKKKKELEQRINNLIDHINSLILKHDITIDVGKHSELKWKLNRYCQSDKYTDQQIVNMMVKESLSYVEREKRKKFIDKQIKDLVNIQNVKVPQQISYQLYKYKNEFISGSMTQNNALKNIKNVIKKFQERQNNLKNILSQYDDKYRDKLKKLLDCQRYLETGSQNIPIESCIQSEYLELVKKEKQSRRKRMLDYRIKKYIPKDKQSNAKRDRLYSSFINKGSEDQINTVFDKIKTKYV